VILDRSGRGRGFTLVEVVVGLLVLQIGLMCALATVLVAARTMERAQTLEATSWLASALHDSLAGADMMTAGVDSAGSLRAAWAPTSEGFTLVVEGPGVPPLRLHGARVAR
jgi:Tfp pilus assembly protein PilV